VKDLLWLYNYLNDSQYIQLPWDQTAKAMPIYGIGNNRPGRAGHLAETGFADEAP